MEKANYSIREGKAYDVGAAVGEKFQNNDLKITSYMAELEKEIDPTDLKKQ